MTFLAIRSTALTPLYKDHDNKVDFEPQDSANT